MNDFHLALAKLGVDLLVGIAWPAVALLGLLFFRSELSKLIGRLKTAKYKNLEIDFQEKLDDAKRISHEVKMLPPPEEKKAHPAIPLTEANTRMMNLGLQPTQSGLDMNYFREIANRDPNLALAALRLELEVLTRNLARGFNVPAEPQESTWRLLNRLFSLSAITSEQMRLASVVLELCNSAVHGQRVSRSEALSIIEVCQVLVEQYLAWLGWGFPDNWTHKKAV